MRKLLAAVLAAVIGIGLVASPAQAHADSGFAWISHPGSGYTYHIPVCPPFGFENWDLTNSRHARVNEGLGKWNALGTQLFYYRTNTDCTYLYNTHTPFVAVNWDVQSTCFFPFGISCNVDVMRTYVDVATEGSAEADDWGNGNASCNNTAGSSCSIYADIRLDYAGNNEWYWGTDKFFNISHGTWAALAGLAHEFGHPAGLGDIPRSATNTDPECDDFVYPDSSNALMCSVIEFGEWNVTPKSHDSILIHLKYGLVA